MAKNNRIPTSVTRSLSFRFDTLAALDSKVEELRCDRSTFVNGAMEHILGIMAHPEFVGRTLPFIEEVNHHWVGRVAALIEEARMKNKPDAPSEVLVKRPLRGIAKRK